MSYKKDIFDIKLSENNIYILEKFVSTFTRYNETMKNYFSLKEEIKNLDEECKNILKQLIDLNKKRRDSKNNYEKLTSEIEKLNKEYTIKNQGLELKKQKLEKFDEIFKIWGNITLGNETQKHTNTYLYRCAKSFLNDYEKIYEYQNNEQLHKKNIISIVKKIMAKRKLKQKISIKYLDQSNFYENYDVIIKNIKEIEQFNNDHCKQINSLCNEIEIIEIEKENIIDTKDIQTNQQELSRADMIAELKKARDELLPTIVCKAPTSHKKSA